MSTPTTIIAVSVEPLHLPMYEPFVIATGTFDAAHNILVRVELASGAVGLGEASPLMSSGGETFATLFAAANEMVPLLEGRDAARWRAIAAFLRDNFEVQSCPRAAVEMALLDALTRHYGVPLYQWFGGAQTAITTDLTIPIVAADHARELAASIAARGIRTIKIKVGGDLATDIERVVAIHEGAPDLALQLDGNQGYDVTGALRLLRTLDHHGIEPILFEQPVHKDDWDGLVAVTARSRVPIAADESVHSPADALRVVRTRAAHVINIKLMKSTFLGALDIVSICRASHTGLMIGAMMESRLATAAAAHFVAGVGGFEYVDLDTPMLIADDTFSGGYAQTGGVYDLTVTTAGHGVTRRAP